MEWILNELLLIIISYSYINNVMIMNNTYDIIMNALGYDIMTDIVYSYYQTGAYN